MMQSQPPVIVSAPAPQSHVNPRFASRSCLFVAIAQLVLGLLTIIFGIAATAIGCSVTGPTGAGIWIGVYYLMCGIIGIVAAKQKITAWIVTFMTLSIIACIFVLVMIIMAARGIVDDTSRYAYVFHIPINYSDDYTVDRSARVAVNGCMLAFSGLMVIFAIWGSVVACQASCSCCNEMGHVQQPMTVQYLGGPQQQVILVPAGQQIVYGQPTYVMQPGYPAAAPMSTAYAASPQAVPVQAPGAVMQPPSYATLQTETQQQPAEPNHYEALQNRENTDPNKIQ